jgi:hypothetical protein
MNLLNHFLFFLLLSIPRISSAKWWKDGNPIPNSIHSLITVTNLISNKFNEAKNNSILLQNIINNAKPGATIIVPPSKDKTPYWFHGGNQFSNLLNITIEIQGEIRAVTTCFDGCWPQSKSGNFLHFFFFENCQHLKVYGQGRIDGSGKGWWARYTIGAHTKNKRPKLFVFQNVTDLLVANLTFVNSPSFNLLLSPVARAEVDHVTVITDRNIVRRLKSTMSERRRLATSSASSLHHDRKLFSPLQPEDLNTDGIDPSGKDIWIHDCNILNDDDSIAVKPLSNADIGGGSNYEHLTCSENMLIENSELTGFGASIGSVPPHSDHNCVKNITFRNISMPGTGKGIYVKSNPTCGNGETAEITEILYEDVTIDKPLWWPIWIGPQQQQEPGSALGRKCALQYPFFDSQCPTQGCVTFTNITLRRVTVTDPLFSPGVVLGNSTNKMNNVVFEDVIVNNPGVLPYNKKYLCKYCNGVAMGRTTPVPSCFKKI